MNRWIDKLTSINIKSAEVPYLSRIIEKSCQAKQDLPTAKLSQAFK